MRRQMIPFNNGGLLGLCVPWLLAALPLAPARAQGCTQDLDCSGQSGSIAWCEQGECVAAQRDDLACLPSRSRFCAWDRGCEDGDPSTVNWCQDWHCFSAPRSGQGSCQAPCAASCRSYRDCQDADPSTRNWCFQGQCHALSRDDDRFVSAQQSCTRSRDCRDGDLGTQDWCHLGRCYHAPHEAGQATCGQDTRTLSAIDLGYFLRAFSTDAQQVVQSFHFESPAGEHQLYPVGNLNLDGSVYGNGNIERRAYFVFDASEVSSAVAAKLRVWGWQPSAANNFSGAYESNDDPFENVGLFEISTPVDQVRNAPYNQIREHSVDVPIWEDLGQGQLFGERRYTLADEREDLVPGPGADPNTPCNPDESHPCGKWLEFELNPQAIAALNAAQGPWALGAAVTSLARNPGQKEWTNNGGIVDLAPEKGVYPTYLTPAPELVLTLQ